MLAMQSIDLDEGDERTSQVRKTKLICTIGPSCSDTETLLALIKAGMNVARLNMSHGDHEWHKGVIQTIRQINKEMGYSVAIMVDTEGGSEVHLKGLSDIVNVEGDTEMVLSIREGPNAQRNHLQVSFEGFSRDCKPGDTLLIDGGMATLRVESVRGPDVICTVVDSGIILPRASVTIRRDGALIKSTDAFLPVLGAKDWNDIDMAIESKVDFIAVSFVRDKDVLENLRSYISAKTSRSISIVAKIEAYESLENLHGIIGASDVVMIARGDLGAQISIPQVPREQKRIVDACRSAGKAVIVASQLLESMHTLPTPTRAEVADISEAVRQGADAVMLSGETAIGLYPVRTLEVLRDVTTHAEMRLEGSMSGEKRRKGVERTTSITKAICGAAANLADSLGARAIFSFTETGTTAFSLSRMRPSASIFAFTDTTDIRLQCSMWWGVVPFRLDFSTDFETNIRRTITYCKSQGMVIPGDTIIVVSHMNHECGGETKYDVGNVLGNSVQVRVVE
jgi:pyruvate kinase